MRAIFFVLVVSTLLSIATCDVSALINSQIDNYETCWVVDTPNANDRLVLFWTINATTSTISVAVSAINNGYIGIGWSRDQYGAMVLGDGVIGYLDTSNNVQINDFNLGDYVPCSGSDGVCPDTAVANGVDNISNATVTYNANDTTTTISFTRPLNTGDPNDWVITNTDTKMLWSLGGKTLIQHASMDPFTINLFNQPACPTSGGASCANHGTCVKGCCVCNVGYTGSDCSTGVSNGTVTSTLGPEIIPSEYTFHQSLDSNMELYWKILGDIIEIAVDAKVTGWVAFGPSSQGNMIGSDAIIGWVDDTTGTITISDTYLTAQSGDCPGVCKDTVIGGTYDIIDYNGNQNNSRTQLKWLRKLNTGDQRDIALVNGNMYVVWGYQDTVDGLVQHTKSGSLKLNFFTGAATATTNLRVVHGALMFIAWGLFVPATSFIARYLKKYSWWFNVHRWINSVMMLAVLVAFGLAISFTAVHFHDAHTIIGLIVTIGAVIQPILGLVADRMYDKSRTEAPWFPDRVHWIIGWAILTLALINVELGLVEYGSHSLTIVYGIWCALVGLFLIAWFIYKQITGMNEN